MPISIGGIIRFIGQQVQQANQTQGTSSQGSSNTASTTTTSPPGFSGGDAWVRQSNDTAYQRLLGGVAAPVVNVLNTLAQRPETSEAPRDPRLPPGAQVPPSPGNYSALANLPMANATPEQIQRLQDALIELGYMDPNVRNGSGYGKTWGPASQGALSQFQRDHGLQPTPTTLTPDTARFLTGPLTTGTFLPRGPKNVLMPQAAYAPAAGSWPPSPPSPDFQALRAPSLVSTLTNFDRTNTTQVRAIQERLLELGFFEPDKVNKGGFGETFGPASNRALTAFQTAHGLDPREGLTPETLELLAAPEHVGQYHGVSPDSIPGRYGTRPPPNLLCEGALETSAAQMNPDTATLTYNNVSLQNDPTVWQNRCLAFVARCYEPRVPLLSAGSAIEAYRNFQAAGQIVNSRTDIPPGVPLFFGASDTNRQAGHVVIFTGRYTEPGGEPIVRSSGWEGRPGIFEVPLSEMERLTGAPYLGWGNVTGQPNPTPATSGGRRGGRQFIER